VCPYGTSNQPFSNLKYVVLDRESTNTCRLDIDFVYKQSIIRIKYTRSIWKQRVMENFGITSIRRTLGILN